MRSVLDASHPKDAALVTKKLHLVWKDPETRRYHRVGQFESLRDGRYAFAYAPRVQDLDSFSPLVQYPDLTRVYLSADLPAFFANRVMSSKRPSFESYLGWLGLSSEAPPVEILARTGGVRATDTFHLVDTFEPVNGRAEGVFFVSGVRYKDSDWRSLQPGQELHLLDDPANPANAKAILLTKDGVEVGWVPDWLVDNVHEFRTAARQLSVAVEQVNPDAPLHLAVQCRLIVA